MLTRNRHFPLDYFARAQEWPLDKKVRAASCLAVWLLGTSLFSIVCIADSCFQLHLSGAILYVIFTASPTMTLLSSLLAPIHFGVRVLGFFLSVMLMFAQFDLLAFLSIAATGLDGTQ